MEEKNPVLDGESGNESSGILEIQERDMGLFRMIHEQGYMTAGEIRSAFWPEGSVKAGTHLQRIAKLIRSGYLEEITCSDRFKGLRLCLIRQKALDLLKAKGLDSKLELFTLPVNFEVSLDHYLKVTNLRIVFREMGFTHWLSERYLREAGKLHFVPDGVIEYSGFKFAVELENTQKAKDRYEYRFSRYRRDSDYQFVFMIFDNPKFRRFMNHNYDTGQVWFGNYRDFLEQKKEMVFENKTGDFKLSKIWG